MPDRRIACVTFFGLCLTLAAGGVNAMASSGSGLERGVTAARPGMPLVAGARVASQEGAHSAARRLLTRGEGAGKRFCTANNGYLLGASFDDVFACGPATGTPDAFDTVGFQCVELSERYLWVAFADFIPNVEDGRNLVEDGHSVLGIPIGVPGPGSLPAVGDVLSMWGAAGADPYGHTAVVTSINVDANGDGSIGIMEENAASTGWDQVTVSHWQESYGDPSWGNGYYYYDHIEWLELKPPVSALASSTVAFNVQGLGADSVATGINGLGMVTGYIDHTASAGRWLQPFLFQDDIWTYPKTVLTSVHMVGINNRGIVAAWSRHASLPQELTLRSSDPSHWLSLPMPDSAVTAGQTTSIDGWGDVSGWLAANHSAVPTSGAVWAHNGSTYTLRMLMANRGFNSPRVLETDHYGDSVGSEMLGTARTYATVWAPWGEAYRLPSLSKAFDSSATAMISSGTNAGSRLLTVVGFSTDGFGVRQAVEWTVMVGSNTVRSGAPLMLAGPEIEGPSSAVAINSSGWIVGDYTLNGKIHRAFLWREVSGWTDLEALLPANSPWIVQSVAGLNAQGNIVGQGYNHTSTSQNTTRAVILTPYPVSPTEPEPIN